MAQNRLFALAVEAVTLQALFIAGEGWHLQIGVRRQAEPWGDQAWVHYDHLNTAEMLQVIEDHLSAVL